MRDILLLTNKEINADACLEKIREIYPNAKENGNGIMIEAKFRAFLPLQTKRRILPTICVKDSIFRVVLSRF